MNACERFDTPDIELYFYDELEPAEQTRVAAHLRACAACRTRLDDLHAIRRALASAPVVEAPSAEDWSGFMRRLDSAVGLPASRSSRSRLWPAASQLIALAATLALVTFGVFMAVRARSNPPSDMVARTTASPPADAGRAAAGNLTPGAALREISAEHLERSKLVVLGLATRDPRETRPADWQYERQLAGSLLADTRLYRLAAQERGMSDVAHVMRDLETVLLEASMTDGSDRESLQRVQRLIARRGLVSNMQMVAASAGL